MSKRQNSSQNLHAIGTGLAKQESASKDDREKPEKSPLRKTINRHK